MIKKQRAEDLESSEIEMPTKTTNIEKDVVVLSVQTTSLKKKNFKESFLKQESQQQLLNAEETFICRSDSEFLETNSIKLEDILEDV